MAENYTDIHALVKETQTLISWKAPMRPYKKRGKKILRFFIAVAFLMSVIIIFFGDPILLLPVWAVLFLFYIMTITPPPVVENKITKFGVETAGITLRWDVLDHFYFTERWGFDILTLVTHAPYNFQAYFVIPDRATKQKVATLLADHIMFNSRPARTITDNLIDIFSHVIPDDDDEEPVKKPHLGVA